MPRTVSATHALLILSALSTSSSLRPKAGRNKEHQTTTKRADRSTFNWSLATTEGANRQNVAQNARARLAIL
jgi:hypothetical protein